MGLKSTAILFAEADRVVIGMLQLMFLLTMALSAKYFGLGGWFSSGLLIALGMFAYQQVLLFHRKRAACFQAFQHNNKVGLVIFLATAIDLFIP